jgi:hypothetical protein
MRDLPPVRPDTLYPRRLALRALAIVLEHYGVTDVTVKLNPDDPEQAFPGPSDGEVRLFLDGWDRGQRAVALVFLQAEKGRVVVERLLDLVRSNHRAEFKPEDIGVFPAPGEPDVDMEVDLSSEIELMGEAMRTVPQRRLARRTRPAVTPSLLRRGMRGR